MFPWIVASNLLVGCAEPEATCPSTCGAELSVVPPSARDGALTVRSEPAGVAFDGALLDARGDELQPLVGVGEVTFPLDAPLALGETYTVRLDHACEPGEGRPACGEVTFRFVASDRGPTGTTAPSDDGHVIDVFVQASAPIVDLLFVVDNSCSMGDNQADLAASGPNLLTWFAGGGTDWHLGVVSTDLDSAAHSGKLRQIDGHRWVDEGTPDAAEVFAGMVQMGTAGSGREQGLGAVYSALELEEEGYNAGFLRDGSDLHVVILSDERDQTSLAVISREEFELWFDGLRQLGPTLSAIVALEGIQRGTSYIQIANQTGGVVWDIAAGGYEGVLESLGVQAAGLRREFFLSRVPALDTLELRVDVDEITLSFAVDQDYTYDLQRNSVTFLEYVPDRDAVVTATYLERP